MRKIIVLEGPDNFGKTEYAKRLAKKLDAEYLKFPNEKLYSGQILRKIINKELPFEPVSFQALQIINRIETYSKLDSNKTYVCDRGKLSGLVYALADDLFEPWVRETADFLPDPDITVLITGRPYGQDTDVYSDPAFQRRVKQLYQEEGKKAGGRVIRVCNYGTIDEVFAEIMRKLEGVI